MADFKIIAALAWASTMLLSACHQPAGVPEVPPDEPSVPTEKTASSLYEAFSWGEGPWSDTVGPDDGQDSGELTPIVGTVLCTGTYNILSPSARQSCPNNSWERAKTAISDILLEMKPDVMALNELESTSINYLKNVLTDYELLVQPNTGGTFNWAPGILYNAERLVKEEDGLFWLSDPEPSALITEEGAYSYFDPVSASTYSAGSHRCCIWALFKDIKTNGRFYFFATHLNFSETESKSSLCNTIVALNPANCRSLMRQIDFVNDGGLPFIVAGDMNNYSTELGYRLLTSGKWVDSFYAAADDGRLDSYTALHPGTAPGVNPLKYRYDEMTRVDHVFTSGFRIASYESIFAKYDNPDDGLIHPSDHIPVKVGLVME